MHVEGRWQRQVFLEQPDELLVQWPQVYGVHRKLAVASDNGDLYMVLEEVEEQGMFAWIVYLDSEERFVEEVEVETLLALATPVQPNWEEHQWFPIR
jgi:hypothetical protein